MDRCTRYMDAWITRERREMQSGDTACYRGSGQKSQRYQAAHCRMHDMLAIVFEASNKQTNKQTTTTTATRRRRRRRRTVYQKEEKKVPKETKQREERKDGREECGQRRAHAIHHTRFYPSVRTLEVSPVPGPPPPPPPLR